MKKCITNSLLVVFAVAVFSSGAFAKPFDEFKDRVQTEYIKPFARDLGGLLGGADFHSGRAMGSPGFNVGGVGVIQFKPEKDNKILTAAGVDTFGIPLIQVGVGLPYKINLVARGMSAAGVTTIGGGLRYGIYKSGMLTKFIPDISVGVFIDKLTHDYFKATHFSASISASLNLPVVKPFVGFGYDNTKLEVKDATNPLLRGMSATAKDIRYTAGVEFSPIPLFYIFGAYSVFHGSPGAQFGLGAGF